MTVASIKKKEALLLSALRLKCRVQKIISRTLTRPNTVYVWDRVPFYREMWKRAASLLSAEFSELAETIWQIRLGAAQTFINIHRVQLDDPVISSLAGNKPFCYEALRRGCLPVPAHVTIMRDEADKAISFLERKKRLVVVKPALDTGSGMGITTHVRSWQECRNAIALASLYSRSIILEDVIPGECYRLLVLNGRMIHAVRRRGRRIRGDGRSSVKQLLARLEPARNGMTVFIRNRDMVSTLFAQDLSMDSVIENGREALVQSYASPVNRHVEVRTIYNEVVTDLVCGELRQQAEQAARLLHSKFAGVDIITPDPSKPLQESGGVINEINTNPGLHHHFVTSSHNGYHDSDDISPAVKVLSCLLQRNRLMEFDETPDIAGQISISGIAPGRTAW